MPALQFQGLGEAALGALAEHLEFLAAAGPPRIEDRLAVNRDRERDVAKAVANIEVQMRGTRGRLRGRAGRARTGSHCGQTRCSQRECGMGEVLGEEPRGASYASSAVIQNSEVSQFLQLSDIGPVQRVRLAV